MFHRISIDIEYVPKSFRIFQSTEEENKCCAKIRCTTSFVTFLSTCLDRDVLVMAYRGRSDLRAEEPDYSMNNFRKTAYHQYILWRYKKWGRGNRKVCPSCLVLAIRHVYRADDGLHMGFKRA
jgi:P2X purinoceptor 7